MSEQFSMMRERLKAGLNPDTGLDNLDEIVEKYGRIAGRPFTYDGHEFQREIIKSTASRIYVRKSSQQGLTEACVQKVLALCAVLKHKRLIFTMPTAGMAAAVSKDRISGLIEQSDYYRGLVLKANDSASQKRIGTNTLYIGGTFGSKTAISVPAEYLINDEVDHSDPVVLGQMSSRLRHATKDAQGFSGNRIMFSTPTVGGFGIDDYFNRGTQKFWAVKCSGCNSWEVPDFFEDFIVPGMDKPLVEMDRSDTRNPLYRLPDSWIKCPGCGTNLWNDLKDPTRRTWVAKYPDRWEESYHINAWDSPDYNPPASIIQQLGEYSNFSDFANQVLGLPFTSADNSFMTDNDHRDRVAVRDLWIYQQCVVKSTTVIGLDVGKVCHLVVLMVSGDMEHVVWAEALPNTIAHPATEEVVKRFEFFNCVKLVTDAGPDITLVNQLVDSKPLGQISACQYVRSVPGLDMIAESDEGRIIKAERTSTLADTMKKHNSGKINYPVKLIDDIFAHMSTLKKIAKRDVSGDSVERFESTNGEDHYAHALNYARIAKMSMGNFSQTVRVNMPPTVGRLKLRRK